MITVYQAKYFAYELTKKPDIDIKAAGTMAKEKLNLEEKKFMKKRGT